MGKGNDEYKSSRVADSKCKNDLSDTLLAVERILLGEKRVPRRFCFHSWARYENCISVDNKKRAVPVNTNVAIL
jgi:hypothetical protein